MSASPEFSRDLSATKLGYVIELKANEAERAAVAKRLGLESVPKLEAVLTLEEGRGGLIVAKGTLRADVVQNCVVTLEPVPASITEQVEFLFAHHPPEVDENDPEAEVIDPILNGHVELGEPLVQTLALCLEPYPRKPGAEFQGYEVG